MSFIDTRFSNVVSSLFLDACAGSPYAVSLYSAQLKEQLQLTQVQLNTVESAGDVGLYLTVVAGVAYESLGPKITAGIGALLSLAGYALMWLAVNGKASSSVPALCLYSFLWNHGSSWLSTCAVTTAIKSMTGDRGVAMGLVRSMFGLSAGLLGVIYFSSFQPAAAVVSAGGSSSSATASLASYFLFCAVAFSGIAIVAGMAARTPSPAESAAPLTQAEHLRIVWAGVIVALLVFYVTGAGVAGAHGSLPPSPAWAFALLALLLPLIGLVFRQWVYARLAEFLCFHRCCRRRSSAAGAAPAFDPAVAAVIQRSRSGPLAAAARKSNAVYLSAGAGDHHDIYALAAPGEPLAEPLLGAGAGVTRRDAVGSTEPEPSIPATPTRSPTPTPTRSGKASVNALPVSFGLLEAGSDAEPMVLHIDDPTARAPVIVYSGRAAGASTVAAEIAFAASAAAPGLVLHEANDEYARDDDASTAAGGASAPQVDAVHTVTGHDAPATPTFASAGRSASLAALSGKRAAASSRASAVKTAQRLAFEGGVSGAAAASPLTASAAPGQPKVEEGDVELDHHDAPAPAASDAGLPLTRDDRAGKQRLVAAIEAADRVADVDSPLRLTGDGEGEDEVGASLCEAVCSLDYLLILLCLFAGTGCGIVVINNLSNLVESLAGGPNSLPTGGELPYLILFCEFAVPVPVRQTRTVTLIR